MIGKGKGWTKINLASIDDKDPVALSFPLDPEQQTKWNGTYNLSQIYQEYYLKYVWEFVILV